jgi:uncharacterized membrane protein
LRRKNADVVVAIAIVALTFAALFVAIPVPVLAILGVTLFAATGYLWSEVLLGSRTGSLERAATATGLAMIVPVLGGLALYVLRISLDRASWTGLMAVAALSGAVAVNVRRRLARPVAESDSKPRAALSIRSYAAFGLAAFIAAGAVVLAHEGAARQNYGGFTQLWLSPDGPTHDIVGITNREGKTTSFQLVVHTSKKNESTYDLILRNGQTWQRALACSAHARLVADLYRIPVLTTPYEYVDTAGGAQ